MSSQKLNMAKLLVICFGWYFFFDYFIHYELVDALPDVLNKPV
jgi:hypothetical protein